MWKYIIVIILVLMGGVIFFFSQNFESNCGSKTGCGICFKLDGSDECFTSKDLTCEQVCTKSDWGRNESKQYTKWEYRTGECGDEELYNSTPVTSTPDGVVRAPGTVVVDRIVHTAGGNFKDSPTPDSICCCY